MTNHVRIPEAQKEELVRAIVTLITVVLGIALTLTTQVISRAILEAPAPVDAPARVGAQAVGETTHFQALDVAGALEYGAHDLYPLGALSDGFAAVYGTETVTGTAAIETALATVVWAGCALAEDASATAGGAATCAVVAAGDTVTVTTWQDDATAATAGAAVAWIAVGQP